MNNVNEAANQLKEAITVGIFLGAPLWIYVGMVVGRLIKSGK